MNNLSIFGKFLDQPILVAKFQKAVPAVLTSGAVAYGLYDISKAEKGKRKERAIKTGITIGATVAAALSAPKIASFVTKRALPLNIEAVKQRNQEIIESFVSSSNVNEKTITILEKNKERILRFKDVKTLFEKFKDDEKGKDFLKKLIPDPENISANDIFSEIGYLSVYGAVPVIGGIIGGSAADMVVDKKTWRDKIPDKIKEGSYQYLANIFMCNVGAGIALAIMEKFGITSKGARAIGMTAGIVLSGIIGGSKIANFIGRNVIDRFFNKKEKSNYQCDDILDIDFKKRTTEDYIKRQSLYTNKAKEIQKERTPEVLDIGLHTDDIATVSLLSGLKWIEPALPIMYTISGYRAGIGYRN